MAIGAIWGEIWNEAIWNTAIWSQVAAEPPVPEATQRHAGRSRRRRLIVEIDGRDFEVSSEAEAIELLSRAKQITQTVVEKARAAPTRINRGLQRPRISTKDLELKQAVAQAHREITQLYDDAFRDLEIRALMRKQFEDEEEEALIRLLM